jgi:flagellar motility protein MotE (MotC chaperone)
MKKIIFLTLVLSTASWAQKTETKTGSNKSYTEEDFIKAVNEEVKKKVDSIKNKSVSEITKELLDKEEQLKLRELELQKEHDSLKSSQNDLAKKYSEFELKQKSFIGCIDKNEEDSKARIGQLVEMISNMKPQKAAEILSVQESEIAVNILQMIDAKKASKIFNFMDKDISAKLQKQYLLLKK